MQITVSGKFSYDISDDAQNYVALLNEALGDADLSDIRTMLKGFVYFPVILSEEFLVNNKTFRSYSRNEMAEFVNIEIPHGEWVGSNDRHRLKMMFFGFQKAILDTSDSKICMASKCIIIERVATRLDLDKD